MDRDFCRCTRYTILGAPRPILGVTLGAKSLDRAWPAALADDRFPGVGRDLGNRCHSAFRTAGVPKHAGITITEMLTDCFLWWA